MIIRIYRIPLRLDIRRLVMVRCAQANKILSLLFVFASEKFNIIQLPWTQIRALVNNYTCSVRTYGTTYFVLLRGEPEKRFIVDSLIYLHEISFYVPITYR